MEGLPDYIQEGTKEEDKWRKRHPNNKKSAQRDDSATGSTQAHKFAQEGNTAGLTKVVSKLGHLVNKEDSNGWTPLHEGARGGFEDIVKVLVDKGADINKTTGGQNGKSALYIAIEENGDDHPIVEFLENLGALSIGPDL